MCKNFSHDWISLPKTMGDLCLFQIMTLLKNYKEKKYIEFKDDDTNFNKISEGNENILNFLIKSNFVNKMYHFLSNGTYSQKDSCLIILCDLSIGI